MKRTMLTGLTTWFLVAAGANAGELTFEKTLIEVTAKPDQEQIEADFVFTSCGDSPATIKRYDAPCSCLEAQISDGGRLVWAAGEKGTVRGLFKVGNFRGTVDKQISILMEDGTRHDLTVRMTMPELVKIEPKTLKWEEGGAAETKVFEITINSPDPLKILDVTATNGEKFPYSLKTIEEGKSYRLEVTPTDTETRGFGLLRVATDSKYKKHQNYQAYVVVTKPSMVPATAAKP
ncbi:DUF1573 domain-containing protein [Roseibacillus persicicus]|uniref:DUF1573 domain-containing protein n=1 Tax=Roseibacillus persicicus TaxID=454148 RepID=UPI00398A6D4D